jgi:hypothetical protein
MTSGIWFFDFGARPDGAQPPLDVCVRFHYLIMRAKQIANRHGDDCTRLPPISTGGYLAAMRGSLSRCNNAGKFSGKAGRREHAAVGTAHGRTLAVTDSGGPDSKEILALTPKRGAIIRDAMERFSAAIRTDRVDGS